MNTTHKWHRDVCAHTVKTPCTHCSGTNSKTGKSVLELVLIRSFDGVKMDISMAFVSRIHAGRFLCQLHIAYWDMMWKMDG